MEKSIAIFWPLLSLFGELNICSLVFRTKGIPSEIEAVYLPILLCLPSSLMIILKNFSHSLKRSWLKREDA